MDSSLPEASTSVPKTPRVRKYGTTPGATPTQQNPNYIPQQEELQPDAGTRGRGRRETRSSTRSAASQHGSQSQPSSRAQSKESTSSDWIRHQLEEESNEETSDFDKHLSALEERILRANDQVVQNLVQSNAQLLADIKEAQIKAIEKTMRTTIASGFTGLTSSVQELTQSIDGLNKNQSIQAHLLNRLEARLDRTDRNPQTATASGSRAPTPTLGRKGKGKGKAKEVAPEVESEEQDNLDKEDHLKKENKGDDDDEEVDDTEDQDDIGGDDEEEDPSPSKGKKRKRKSKKELMLQYCLDERVTDQEAKNFEELFHKNPLAKPCTTDDFRYHINGKPASAWNKGAALVFVQDKKVEKGKYGRKYGRKSTLFYQRRGILDGLTPLRKYLPVFDNLGIPGMSSNEEDTDAAMTNTPQYKTTRPLWRSLDLEYFFELLDACHMLVRMPTESTTGTRYSRGAPPRFRIRTRQDSDNKTYVKGLPRNFYRAEWLEEQEQGWAKGGEGLVNLVICPKRSKALVFPTELKE
ncbi:hypothetical protein C8R42DRAFT_725413 [Lentinula raphanica]|nr:hypothetical protein C8R42DRAFT_725413 [Lentinula raphanica]